MIFARNQWLSDLPVFSGQADPITSDNELPVLLADTSQLNSQSSSESDIVTTAEPLNSLAQSPVSTPSLFESKNIIAGAGVQRGRWTPTPLPTNTPTPSPTPVATFVSNDPAALAMRPAGLSPGEKWIDVNLSTQTLVAFEGAAPVFDSLVSTGLANHPTVTGQFRIWLRFASQDMNGYRLGYDYYLKGVPYVQYFYQDYALHGTFWHNNFGRPMSHGCVNLPTPAAEWLFNWAANGTVVNIHH
jgi:lipoprotein-anchoring transpeptidase ErfK/SrfK